MSLFALNMFDASIVAILDVSKNPLTSVEYDFFHTVEISDVLIPATDIMCCMLSDGSLSASCKHNGDMNECKDLLGSSVLGYLIWLICLLVAIPNLICFFKLYELTNSSSVCLGNLVTGCLAVLPYLCVLGVQDLIYEDAFYYERIQWPSGIKCCIAMLSSFISSQISITLVVTIAAQRTYITAFPFNVPPSKKASIMIATTAWFVWTAVALIPHLTNYLDVWQFKVPNDMCLYHDLRVSVLWKIVFVFVFVGLNIAMHIAVIVCCCIIYRCVVQSSKNVRRSQQKASKRVFQVRKKMVTVSLSTIVSNLPMVLISLLTLCGIVPSDLVWEIIAVVVVPLPSIIYPIVYM